jgi:peptide/nickel transport system permease protein
MASFLAGRLAVLLATLLAASIVIFVFTEILPGDPASFMLGLNAEPDTVAAVRHGLGLDLPPLARYFAWLAGLFHGDFGLSYTYRVPVAELIADRLWVSLPLALFALALSVVIGIPSGVIAAMRRNSPADVAVLGVTQVGIAVPNFWFAMLMVLLFSVTLHWFSAGGFPGWNEGLLPGLRALLLPALALALPEASILARVMRSALLDTLSDDYVRTARAKGLTRTAAIRRHAFRNALIPVTTIIGLQFSFLLAGAIVIENVFFLPGIGRLIYQAVTQRDLIVVQSVVLLLVAAVVTVTFAVDVLYALIDPRLRRSSA